MSGLGFHAVHIDGPLLQVPAACVAAQEAVERGEQAVNRCFVHVCSTDID